MQAAEERDGHDLSNRVDGTAERGVLPESKMSTGAIVIIGVGAEDPAKMRFAQDHDVIQSFSADGADEPFDVSVLPGRAGRGWSIPDAHRPDPPFDHDAVGAVSVAD